MVIVDKRILFAWTTNTTKTWPWLVAFHIWGGLKNHGLQWPKKFRLSDLILCSTHHQSFQICSISVWLEGSFKGPQFTFLCDVVGQSRVAKVAAGLIISSQGQKMSRWILDAPAVPEIKSNDILCTIAFGIDNKIGSICWHLGLWAGHWQARLPESCAAKYLSEIRRYSCGKAVPMRGVLRIDMML